MRGLAARLTTAAGLRLAAVIAVAASGIGALFYAAAHLLAHVFNVPHPW